MKHYIISLISVLLLVAALPAVADEAYKYRITLADKPAGGYTLDAPEEYLSAKAIARRERQGLTVDSTDLPVSQAYVEQIVACGVRHVTTSRWLNSIVVATDDTVAIAAIRNLPFVTGARCVWRRPTWQSNISRKKFDALNKTSPYDYGDATTQVSMINADSLHRAGFRGEGMTIAVIDAGFYNIDKNPTIDQSHIVGTRDFVSGTFNYDGDTHGAMVLSCMLSDDPGNMIGTAPEADYWLLVSEDIATEYPVEEDYWIAALEFADSVGVDLVNTSLGYYNFDDPSMDYTWDDLDGATAPSSRAARLAADKGMMLLVAAGNEGDTSWEKICVPADADGILTVGSVTAGGGRSYFSSTGNSADGRIKPDVMALGSSASMVIGGHFVITASGTSFASPILCGGVACLWQAHPRWSVARLREMVITHSSYYDIPNNYMGYGIPDLYAAHNDPAAIEAPTLSPAVRVTGRMLQWEHPFDTAAQLTLYDTTGALLHNVSIAPGERVIELPATRSGLYIAVITCGEVRLTQKIKIAL